MGVQVKEDSWSANEVAGTELKVLPLAARILWPKEPPPGPLNTCPLNMTVAQLSLPFFKTKTMFPGMTCSSSGVSGTNPNSTRWASPSRALQGGDGRCRPLSSLDCVLPMALWYSNGGPGARRFTPGTLLLHVQLPLGP